MKIIVQNVCHKEVVSLHLPLIIGEIESATPPPNQSHLEVWNASWPQYAKIQWPVIDRTFKALVRLGIGENIIHLKFENELSTIHLIREIPKFVHFVRPVYIVCSDNDGYFQAPADEDSSPSSAQERIKLAAMLIQTFTAEKMREHGFGRQNFQLEVDECGEPLCHIFQSKLTLEESHSKTGNELWTYFAKELMSSNFQKKETCKWFCFMSFTRYFPPEGKLPKTHGEVLSNTRGHTALGGGGLALFGTGNLHTWAPSLEKVYSYFTNNKKIDRKELMDDSAYREYYWANYATGLGASLHELGHTFDLAHTPTGIMARGFDDIYKVFTIRKSRNRDRSKTRHHYRSGSRDSNISRTSSTSSVESITGSSNQSAEESSDQGQGSGQRSDKEQPKTQGQTHHKSQIHQRPTQLNKNKDVCFGSPLRKTNHSTTYIAPPPVVVKMEKGFTPVKSPSTLTVSVKNYDGTQQHKIVAHDDGIETVTDMLLGTDGRLLAKSTTRERTSSCSSVSSTSSLQSPFSMTPSNLPNSPEEPLVFPEVTFKDGGAHWYRSSAVLLFFHKWFNKANPNDPKRQPTISGSKVMAVGGLRLVELRSDPEGIVFFHWEFLRETPPTNFFLKLSAVRNLPTGAEIVTVLAEDSYGNITRRKVRLVDFQK